MTRTQTTQHRRTRRPTSEQKWQRPDDILKQWDRISQFLTDTQYCEIVEIAEKMVASKVKGRGIAIAA